MSLGEAIVGLVKGGIDDPFAVLEVLNAFDYLDARVRALEEKWSGTGSPPSPSERSSSAAGSSSTCSLEQSEAGDRPVGKESPCESAEGSSHVTQSVPPADTGPSTGRSAPIADTAQAADPRDLTAEVVERMVVPWFEGSVHVSICGAVTIHPGDYNNLASIRSAVLSVAREAVKQETEALVKQNERLYRERYAALSVKSKDGLLASEWLLRTGLAESRARAAEAEAERMRKALEEIDSNMAGVEPETTSSATWAKIARQRRLIARSALNRPGGEA